MKKIFKLKKKGFLFLLSVLVLLSFGIFKLSIFAAAADDCVNASMDSRENANNDNGSGSSGTVTGPSGQTYGQKAEGGTVIDIGGGNTIVSFPDQATADAFKNSDQYDPNTMTVTTNDALGIDSPISNYLNTNSNYASSADALLNSLNIGESFRNADFSSDFGQAVLQSWSETFGFPATKEGFVNFVEQNGGMPDGMLLTAYPTVVIYDYETGQYYVDTDVTPISDEMKQTIKDENYVMENAAKRACNEGQATQGGCYSKIDTETCKIPGNCDDDDDNEKDDDNTKDDDNEKDDDNSDDDNDDDTSDDDDDDTITFCNSNCDPDWLCTDCEPATCTKQSPAPVSKPAPKPHNQSFASDPATCDNPTYSSTDYSYSTIACGYAEVQTTVVTNINYPTSPSDKPLYAGHSFTWGRFSSSQTVSSSIFDTSAYTYEKASLMSQISAERSYIGCLMLKNIENQKKIAEIQHRITSPEQGGGGECWSQMQTCTGPEDNRTCTTTYVADGGCLAKAYNDIQKIVDMINDNIAKMNASNAILQSLSAKMNVLERCGAEISGYSGFNYTTQDVTKFSGARMVLNDGYTQEGNTIVAIMKGTGELLTSKVPGKSIDLPNGILQDTEHSAQFTIPVTTKNGTIGRLYINQSDSESSYAGDTYPDTAKYPSSDSLVNATVEIPTYNLNLDESTMNYAQWEKYIKNNKVAWINAFCTQKFGEYIEMKYGDLLARNRPISFSCYGEVERDIEQNARETMLYDFNSDSTNKTITTVDHKAFYDRYSKLINEVEFSVNNASLESMKSGKNEYQLSNKYEPKGGDEGQLAGQTMNEGKSYPIKTTREGANAYYCDITILNPYICSPDDCPGSLNLIYRQISLSNPFPNAQTGGQRQMGKNWNMVIANTIITNNRGVKEDDVYNLEPLYTITLTPTTIRNIRRDYGNNLTEFDLNCDDNGRNCVSDFLHTYLENLNAIN